MKKSPILFFIYGCAFFTGCVSQEARTSKEREQQVIPRPEVNSAVPLPARTPYDSNPDLKVMYLKGYARGYGYGIQGLAASCDIAGSKEHPEIAQAFIEGNFAGQDAGGIAWDAKEKLNQSTQPTQADGLRG